MSTTGPAPTLTLTVSRTFNASRERVYAAWTDPAQFQRWWGPPGTAIPSIEMDVRVGGSYRVAMVPPGMDVVYVKGTYREVVQLERLVYTWEWEGNPMEGRETLVTVEFRDLGAQTEVTITHEGFPDEYEVQLHADGWNGCFEGLDALLEGRPHP
jgi:uncharacterized protein YndB with AHSA1/START domain